MELRGAMGSACFLSTSWTLPTSRILEMVDSHPSLSSAFCGLGDIHMLKTTTIPILLHVLSHTLPTFIESRLQPNSNHKPVKLVVVDALTELFHSQNKTSTTTLAQRAKDVAEISRLLHTLADKHSIAIVVLNEVADVFDKEVDFDAGSQHGEILYRDQARWFSRAHSIPGEDRKEAALGLTWANQVNARVMLTRTDRMVHLDQDDARKSKRRRLDGNARSDTCGLPTDQQPVRLRHLTVIFSSIGPPGSLDYIVSEQGVVVIPPDEQSHLTSVPSQPDKPPNTAKRSQLPALSNDDAAVDGGS